MTTVTGQDANMAGRVRAAAQLVLQDLDPEARKRRQEFMSANARVCTHFHIKKIRNFNKAFFNTSSFAGVQEFMLYLKITVGEISKVTKPTEVRKEAESRRNKNRKTLSANQKVEKYKTNIADGTAEIVVDQLKTFGQEVNRRKDSDRNLILFELLNIESATTRTIEAVAKEAVRMSNAHGNDEKSKKVTLIGTGECHLWELINEEQGEKVITLRCKEQKVCEADIEFICKYGSFGYGYSHQLYGLNDKTPQERIQDSIFFRLPGIDSRNGNDDCLLPCHIGRPRLMDQSDEDVEIGSPIVRAQLWNLSEESACFLTENTDHCVYLTKLIKKRGRLPRLKEELGTKPHRHERIEFLKQHILRDTTNKNKTASEGKHADLSGETVPDLQRRKSEVVKEMLENVTPLIEISDGINTRQKSRGRQRFNQSELDSGNYGQSQVELLGVETTHRRNLSTISATGFFDTSYAIPTSNDPPLEDSEEEEPNENLTNKGLGYSIASVAATLKNIFTWRWGKKTTPTDEAPSDDSIY